MAELPEIRLGTQLINRVAVGDILMGWNELTSEPAPPTNALQNFITASGITDGTQISAVTTLYNELSSSALLDKMDAIYPFVGGTETAHSYNLLDTGSFTLSFTGGWTHNSNGITGDGSTTYANTSFVPTQDNTGFTSSGSLGIYSLTTGGDGYDMGSEKGTNNPARQTALITRYSANDAFYAGTPISSSLIYTGGLNDGSGLYIASTQTLESIGSIAGETVITASVGPYDNSDRAIYIGAFNGKNGISDYTSRTYGLSFIGSGLEEADHSTLYDIIQTYQTTLSRQVIGPIPTDTRLVYLDAEDTNSYPGSGSVWTDLDGNHNVTLSGSYSYGSTPQGNIDFDGSTGQGDFASQISLTEFTLATWFRMDGASLNTIVGDDDSTQAAQPKILFYADGDVQFRAVQNGSSVRMDIGFDTGSMLGDWHMLTVKRDASNNVYSRLDNGTWVTGSSAVGGTFTIEKLADNGNYPQNFDGAISNMLIYSSSLSDAKVSDIYNNFNPNF